MPYHPIFRRPLRVSALAGVAAWLTTTAASATTGVFFPAGSSAHVDRQHVTVALGAKGTTTWNTIDISGAAPEVGVIVAVKAGGRVELAGRTWVDVVETAAQVTISAIAAGDCKAISASVSSNGEGGVSVSIPKVSASGEGNSGCNEGCSSDESVHVDGGSSGGCYSNSSSPSGGCGGCGSIEPSEHGHPGCSAFACSPMDPNGSSSGSSGSSGGPSTTPKQVGPYDVVQVRASDGSALAWLQAHGYDPGVSFSEGAAALEKDGYELFALRARSSVNASIVESLRIVTTSPTPSVPLRLARMGAGGASSATPLTVVVLGSSAQKLTGIDPLKIDGSKLAWNGSSSNYESLVTALLGTPAPKPTAGSDAGADAGTDGGVDAGVDAGTVDAGGPPSTRWLLESSRTMSNRRTATGEGGSDASGTTATLADLFHAQCGDRAPEKHSVCSGEPSEAGAVEVEAGAEPSDASLDGTIPEPSDGGTEEVSDGGTTSDCKDVDRQSCDDIDLAIAPNGTAVVTRYRGVVAGDPAVTTDLVFEATGDLQLDGHFFVRGDGVPGLCEAIAGADVSASASGTLNVDEGGTCKQAPIRPWSTPNLGPLALFLVAIRAIAAIMRRARR